LGGRPGLTSVAAGEIALKDALSTSTSARRSLLAYAGGLEVLTVGSAPPDPGQFLSSQLVSDTLVELSERCDVLLIDTRQCWLSGMR
jgi:MinD-like ATPase involved in chromosome partitioning or flagellar assembly